MTEYLGKDERQIGAAQTRASTDPWLDWLAAALSLNQNCLLLCSFPEAEGKLLLTGCDVETIAFGTMAT